ncbi:unnamed protein product [Closterium sp. NIES-65]|nr:unnamed protein product [Closterium sp. NIES-65]
MPPKRSSKVTAEVTLPDDLLMDPFTTPAPVVDGAEKQGSNDAVTVNAVTDNAAKPVKESANTTAADVAGGSGLSVEEKFQDNQAPVAVLDEFLEDDEDEELEIDIAKEDAFRLRYTTILLIPMVLSQEIKAIIAAVRLLMTKVWSSSLTENAGVTANIQEMIPGFVAKTRFCRLQISFLDERDAHHIKFHVFEYQKENAPAIKCIWQHTENASYLKEKATRPLAIEVVFRRVPANIVPDVLKDLLVRFKLKKRQQSAFKEGFGFHRVAHPLTGADTDVIKGLVVQHPGDRYRWRHMVDSPMGSGEKLMTYLSHLSLTISVALAAASLRTFALVTPILKDPSIALVSTGSNREEWICTQVCCGKAKGKTFLAAADHIISSTHLLNQEKMGTATKASMDKAALAALGRPGIRKVVEAALVKAVEDGDGNFELLLGRLNAGLRAYTKEENKRVKKTTAHLAEVVAELHQEQMRNPSCQKTSDLFHVRDAQLREYHASKRDRLHVMTGTDAELAGEVPSPFLSARVKVRKQKTQIAELKVGDVKISDSPGILTAATKYFTDLFGTDGRTSTERWKPLAGRKLDAETAAGLAADWTEEEVKQAFKALADGKSPGKDGLPKELFERHWDVLGKEFLRMAQSFSVSATIPASIKEAITILLHKKGEKDNLDNYRPITLLNFTYKVLARVVANRMKMHLHKVISAEQYGFIPGRRISEAIGVVADVIEAAKKGNEDWYMLLVDFRKAFDSVSRSFLFTILKEMGFPERFVGWVEGLHKDTRTRLLINGWLGEAVDVKSGVRQGCPLAPYLFLCAVEPLAQEAERRKIGLCNKANQRLAYVGYADDTTLFLDGKRQIARAEKLLAWFAGLSGLQTNKGKSVILPIGHNIGRRPGTLGGFKWAKADEAERVMGVWVTPSGSSEPTWKRAFEKIIVELIKWKALFLTIAARVVIINCYITPRIAYQAQVYPPSEEIWKKLVKLIHNFLTGNNASAEKGFVLWNWGLLTTPKADGGLGASRQQQQQQCRASHRHVVVRATADEEAATAAASETARIKREEEKFAVINTGKWECKSCGYIYDQFKGDPVYPIAPGVSLKERSEDWLCPSCGSSPSSFGSLSKELAGFAQNQGYGLGGNSLTSSKKDDKKQDCSAFGGLDWREVARPAPPMLDLSKPRVYYFALANAYSLMDKGALLEEVLADGIRRSQRGGRARDVWMVMEPVFLDHPSLASLKAAIRPPTAAIVSTNGDWMLTIVHEMLPQATIGKFYAPTPQLPDPLKSKLTPGDVALGGGGIWH